MVGRKIKIGTGLVAAVAATMAMFPANSFADYAPTTGDVVGVGSDTLQQLGDFVADGDFTGNVGYNSGGNKNKFISIDATADSNTRLAYGPQGLGPTCAPGDGATVGTANANGSHADSPCVLNPTVVLRAGKPAQQRPNGSGAGFNLLVADTNLTGANTGKGKGVVDFSRASSARGGGALYDSVTVGKDPLQILSSAAGTTNAVALSAAQLLSIYQCTSTKWTDVGGTSSDSIVPLAPQVGSGTRDSFLKGINGGSSFTPGPCVQNVEENDPEAIQAASYITYGPVGSTITQSGSKTAMDNAIEPMSGGRLNLFQGKLGTTGNPSNGVGGYFKDPSCPFSAAETAGTVTNCIAANNTLTPNVFLWSTGSPSSGSLFNITRSLYIYFRHADVVSTKKFQPGSSLNWVQTMLYNPCPNPGVSDPTCSIDPVTLVEYGPGGAPWVASAQGQANIAASGIQPFYAYTASGP